MKKILPVILIALFLFQGTASVSAMTQDDFKDVVKITKKMRKLSDKNNFDELSKYYSENYKSFDGYGKKELFEIFKTAAKIYPNSKTKETITNVEANNDTIKVFIDETSKTRMDITGEDAKYALNEKVKGEMNSKASYSMIFKKENEAWKVVGDEIYDEITAIKYGEAIEAVFKMDTPKSIKSGEEYTVKTTIEVPFNRFAVGSIGHDKIIFPPQKYFDPYRAINKTGILERVMTANGEGKNEYANSTFAFIAPYKVTKKGSKKIIDNTAAISGMGIYVKRINLAEKNESAL